MQIDSQVDLQMSKEVMGFLSTGFGSELPTQTCLKALVNTQVPVRKITRGPNVLSPTIWDGAEISTMFQVVFHQEFPCSSWCLLLRGCAALLCSAGVRICIWIQVSFSHLFIYFHVISVYRVVFHWSAC